MQKVLRIRSNKRAHLGNKENNGNARGDQRKKDNSSEPRARLALERTYGTLSVIDDKWAIEGADPHVLIRLKRIFEFVKKYESDIIFIPMTDEYTHELEWFMMRYPLSYSEEVKSMLHKKSDDYVHSRNESEKILMPDYTPMQIEYKGKLKPFQEVARDFTLHNKKVLIGDDIGLGKTFEGMSLAGDKRCLPMLVVCQTHLPLQWTKKIEEFLGDGVRTHFIKTRKAYSLPPADIYITKYSCLIGWVDVLPMMGLKTVVFDEAQELRRAESEKYRVARRIAQDCEYVMGLTASPVYNYGDEIYNIMDLIKPSSMGTWGDFSREWISGFREVNDPQALGTYLRENHLMLRRTKHDVGMDTDPVNVITQYVDPDQKELAKVEDLAKKLATTALEGSFTTLGQARRELDIMVRQATGVAKAKSVAQYAKLFLENGEKILLVGWHRSVYEIWNKQLKDYNPVMYTGSESQKQKQEAIDKFCNTNNHNVFILSLRSGIGIDGLQHHCKTVLFGELDWSPKVHEQVIGRLDRTGQKDQVTAVYILTDSGSDPVIVDLLGLKASQAQGINDPLLEIQQVHSDKTRLQKLAESILEKGMK